MATGARVPIHQLKASRARGGLTRVGATSGWSDAILETPHRGKDEGGSRFITMKITIDILQLVQEPHLEVVDANLVLHLSGSLAIYIQYTHGQYRELLKYERQAHTPEFVGGIKNLDVHNKKMNKGF